MSYTLLVITLVLSHAYAISGMHAGTSTSKDPGCKVIEDKSCNYEDKDLICVDSNGTKYGYLQYEVNKKKNRLFIDSINVEPDYRKRGVATALLNHFIEHVARARKFEQISLQVAGGTVEMNTAAMKLYKNAGFEVVKSKCMCKMKLVL